jgi:AmiR/NasT family two-component response regulator
MSMDQSLRIAVADGDEITCRFYEQFLPTLGHRVCVARTGRQLVEQCRTLRPDLVITEALLPDLDGLAAADEIARDRPTPVILVSDSYPPLCVARALAGDSVYACLTKPLNESGLAMAVAVASRRFRQSEALRADLAGLQQTLEERKLVERAKGMVMKYVGVTEEEAFRRLRKLASDRNLRLAEAARGILTAGEVFHEMEGPPPADRRIGRRARDTNGPTPFDSFRPSAAAHEVQTPCAMPYATDERAG